MKQLQFVNDVFRKPYSLSYWEASIQFRSYPEHIVGSVTEDIIEVDDWIRNVFCTLENRYHFIFLFLFFTILAAADTSFHCYTQAKTVD